MNSSPIRFKLPWFVAALALASFIGLLGLAGYSARASAAAATVTTTPAAAASPTGAPPRPAMPPMPPMPLLAMMGDPRHVDAIVERLLSRADAGVGDDQREQLKSIFRNAAADLASQRTAPGDMHDEAMRLFVSPTVDAREVEALRQKSMARQDDLSRSVAQAFVEASRVLTVEQRQKIAAVIASGPMGGPPNRPHPPGGAAKDAQPANPSR